VPTSFFLLSLFLYEPVSLLLALVGAARGRSLPEAPALGTLFGAWFVAALLLFSFSNGRTAQQAVQVAMPLVLLAGGVLGDLLARIDWDDVRRGVGGGIVLAVLGLIFGLGALGVLLHRAADPFARSTASSTAAIVVMAVIVPLVWTVRNLAVRDRAEGRSMQPARIALAVVATLLAAYGLRSATQLSLYRAADGTELLAQRVATGAVIPAVEGIDHLSRDVTLDQGSVRDVTGGHGLTVAAERSVEWPFRWYFRDYPDFTTVADGQAAGSDAQVVIAPGEAVLSRSGYTVHAVPWRNGVPAPYANPDPLSLLTQAVDPRRWFDGVQFLLFREGIEPPVATNVNIGLDASLAARVSPATGPYHLSDRPGPGSAAGQFNQPIGVAVAPDGTIYVVDQGNSRIERFDAGGSYLGAWDAKSGLTLARTDTGLGPTGIAVAPDGTVYVADTWNHRVVALDRAGQIVHELGGPAGPNGSREAADTTDDPALVTTKTGEFFGPRAVAIAGDEIYVVDTGNERVQVFSRDGTFKRVWGGYGSGPGQMIEPVGIAIGPDGLVYVADSGNARISVFTNEGKPVAQWPVPAWPPKDPTGARPSFQPYLAFGPDGALYASASQSGEVVVLDRQGKTIDTLRMAGPDQLDKPIGLAFTPSGSLLISDIGRNAVFEAMPAPHPGLAATPVASPAATPLG
jgi:DNA-binding beta-propeller fold protein YncE